MMQKIMNFIKDEDGLELTEYAVIGGLIVIATVAAITLLSGQITAGFNAISGVIETTP